MLPSVAPPDQEKVALKNWRADKANGLSVLSAAQCVGALRGLVRARGSPLLPAAVLEASEPPTLARLEAALPRADWLLLAADCAARLEY